MFLLFFDAIFSYLLSLSLSEGNSESDKVMKSLHCIRVANGKQETINALSFLLTGERCVYVIQEKTSL